MTAQPYTPTDDEVRDHATQFDSALHEWAYDRWLAAHDAGVVRDLPSRDEIAEAIWESGPTWGAKFQSGSPERQAEGLRQADAVLALFTPSVAADHDAKVLEAAAEAMDNDDEADAHLYNGDVHLWLRARAARIRNGGQTDE